ncbi:MAG: GGDEF domain-containing protein [Alphaproteobacteria bacterium]|nr:GGDEF domain-containing protein [Alphaproteobacteria bacterium]
MTTDYIQHEDAAKQPKFFGIRIKKDKPPLKRRVPLELTRNNPFVDGTQDMFDVLAQHSWGDINVHKKTANILQKAGQTISEAEEKLSRQNKRIKMLERLNPTDELTGLYNRAGFELVFKRELARTKRHQEHAGILVLIDIESYDSLKAKEGRDAAEAGLKLVAKILADEIREMDVAARLSEHEFVLLFTNTAADKVVDRVQKLALRINNLSFIWKKQEVNISASLGLRSYGPQDNLSGLFKSEGKAGKTP